MAYRATIEQPQLPRGGEHAAVTLTHARDSGRVGASLHHRGDLLRRVLTGEAAKDDQTAGQAGRQVSKQASCKVKATAGGYSSPSRPGDTKKLFIICLLLLRSRPAGGTPAPSILHVFLSNPSSQRVLPLRICLPGDESALQTRASLSSPRRVGMVVILKVVCPSSPCHSTN